MKAFLSALRVDPIPALLFSKNAALSYFVEKDLLGKHRQKVRSLWELPGALHILRKQRANGSWKYPGILQDMRARTGYYQLETFRQVGFLVEKYGCTKEHPALLRAAEFLFTFQTSDGDFRGIYGSQYATTYSPMIAELLIKAGFDRDPRVRKSLTWLLRMRQNDGGWAIPLRTVNANYRDAVHAKLIEPDRTKPFSHLITGCALRALAAHPKFRKLPETKKAGELLMSRLFKRDKYPDRNAISFWTGFSYPFWFTDLLSSLDSLSRLGFSKDEPQIKRALQWIINHQSSDGSFKKLRLLRGQDKQQYLWLTLQVCRVFKRFYSR